MKEYIELESQSTKLLNEMKKKNSISFINGIKSYIGLVKLKLNDDLINDQITSLWLIKNELDQYLD